jgi:DNA repair protein RecO (recombination protein O)
LATELASGQQVQSREKVANIAKHAGDVGGRKWHVLASIIKAAPRDSLGNSRQFSVAAEKALALVVRGTDWSETSRICTLWTREFGKVRVLAKGGRRLKSNFEVALDLLTVCSIVLLRKSSGGLDLLTEAQVVERFPRLRSDLPALHAAYYVAELLADWTHDYDPHPVLFDEARATLQSLGTTPQTTGTRLARFELVLLRELGYRPVLDSCIVCGKAVDGQGLAFSAGLGGVVCPSCQPGQRERWPLSPPTWQALRALSESGEAWQNDWPQEVRKELRQFLGRYVTYLMGRRPRLLPYLGS